MSGGISIIIRIGISPSDSTCRTVHVGFVGSGPTLSFPPNLAVSYLRPIVKPDGTIADDGDVEHMILSNTVHTPDPSGERIDISTSEFTRRDYGGTILVEVTWTPKGESSSKREALAFPAGTSLNKETTIPVQDACPQLSVLLAAPLIPAESGSESVAWTENPSNSQFATYAAAVLDHVMGNLDAGLGRFWKSVPGIGCCDSRGTPLSEVSVDAMTSREELEEAWAQQFSEMITFTPYAGPGSMMHAPIPDNWPADLRVDEGHKRDTWCAKRLASSTNPMFQLVNACQQLATFGLVTRGHTTLGNCAMDSHQLDIGDFEHKEKIYRSADELAQWMRDISIDIRKSMDGNLLKPATCFFYYNSKNQFPHLAVMLRAMVSYKRAQLADTGAWIDNPVRQGCLYDTSYDQILTPHGAARCNGILCPPESAAIGDAIRRARLSRPLGRARLVIGESSNGTSPSMIQTYQKNPDGTFVLDSNKQKIEIRRDVAPFSPLRWASEWLPMYRPNTPNETIFSPARMFASLRGIPYSQHLDVRWQFQIPQFPNGSKTESGESRVERILGSSQWWNHAEILAWSGILEYGNRQGLPNVTGRCNQFRALGLGNTPTRSGATGAQAAAYSEIDQALRSDPSLRDVAKRYFLPPITP